MGDAYGARNLICHAQASDWSGSQGYCYSTLEMCSSCSGVSDTEHIARKNTAQRLKGHWTSITSSPNFFQKKLRFLNH